MEKLVIKGKKEVKNLLADSLHQTVQALGVAKSKKKTSKLIDKSAKRIAELVSTQMKKEQKKFKTIKAKKVKEVDEPVLEKI
jgi:hypothetical protein